MVVSIVGIVLSVFVMFALYVQTKRGLEMWAKTKYLSDNETERLNRALDKVMEDFRKTYG